MKKIYILTFLSVLLITFISCRSNQQSKLVGTWKFVPHTKPDSSNLMDWYFYSGDLLEVVNISLKDTSVKKYSYSLDGSQLSIYGDTNVIGKYVPGPSEYRGKYWVDVLDSDYLKCIKEEHAYGIEGNAYLRIELVKK